MACKPPPSLEFSDAAIWIELSVPLLPDPLYGQRRHGRCHHAGLSLGVAVQADDLRPQAATCRLDSESARARADFETPPFWLTNPTILIAGSPWPDNGCPANSGGGGQRAARDRALLAIGMAGGDSAEHVAQHVGVGQPAADRRRGTAAGGSAMTPASSGCRGAILASRSGLIVAKVGVTQMAGPADRPAGQER
jgi:hypothetical protein